MKSANNLNLQLTVIYSNTFKETEKLQRCQSSRMSGCQRSDVRAARLCRNGHNNQPEWQEVFIPQRLGFFVCLFVFLVVKFEFLEHGTSREYTFHMSTVSFPHCSHTEQVWSDRRVCVCMCSVPPSRLLLSSLKLRRTLLLKLVLIWRTNGLPVHRTNSIQLYMVGGRALMEDDRSPHSVSYV